MFLVEIPGHYGIFEIALCWLPFIIWELVVATAFTIDDEEDGSPIGKFFVGLIGAFIVFGEGLLVVAILLTVKFNSDNKIYDEYYKTEYHEVLYDDIYSVTRENEVSGRWVLGTGYINGKQHYYFYVKVEANTYQLKDISYNDDIYIVETTDGKYCITENKKANSDIIYHEIRVPIGTIVQSFSV